MRVALLTHPSALEHDAGWGHPERPERIGAVVNGVHDSGLGVVSLEPTAADFEMLTAVHDERYVAAIERFCLAGGGSLDPDTFAVPASWDAALRAAGAGHVATTALRAGDADVAFVAMRPPGHHALASRAMGFCLFNNIAVTAAGLTARGERVAVVDWDVHHGNGTEDMFFSDPRVLYVSWHESPFYPGTGTTPGASGAEGTTINFPFPMGTDGGPYAWTMAAVVAPVLRRFAPDWLLVSAGYDAHRADPLASIRLGSEDYALVAAALAAAVPPSRTVFFLEGGYDLQALRSSTAATLRGTAAPAALEPESPRSGPGWDAARRAALVTARVWDL